MKTKSAFIVFCLFVISFPAFAAKIFVSEPTGNAPANDASSVRELLKIAVETTNGFTLSPSATDADYALNSNLVKLGDSYLVNVKKVDKAGAVRFSEQMKATNMSDMDTVTARLGKAVLLEQSAKNSATVADVTAAEEKQNTRRIEATRQWIVSIGPGWKTNLRSSGGGFTFALGYLWGLDPNFAVNMAATFNNGQGADSSSYSDFSIGVDYHLSQEKISPFIGGRFGWATAKPNGNCTINLFGRCDSSRASGWAVNTSAGVKFFRTSSVNVAVLGTYYLVFDKVGGRTPSLFTTQLAVYF